MNHKIKMLKTTPLVKGLIIGGLMLLTTLALSYFKVPPSSPILFSVYILYALGIGWAMRDYLRSGEFTGRFAQLFNVGFRCFIVVALIMVVFIGVYSMINPEYGDASAEGYREALRENKDLLPADIENEVKKYRDTFTTRIIQMAVFQWLLLGVVFTIAWTVPIMIRYRMRQQQTPR